MRNHMLRSGNSGPSDPNFSNVSLLLSFNGANGSTTFTDSSSTANVFTAYGSAQLSTAQYKFGGAAFVGNGTSSYILATNNTALALPGNFTVETWVYPTGLADWRGIFSLGTFTNNYMTLRLQGNGTVEGWIQAWNYRFSGGSISTNAWSHIAFVRNGTSTNNLKLYLNGTQVAQYTNNFSIPGTGYICVGRSYPDYNAEHFLGYIDDVRVTKGIARYTANFTPPTLPFPKR